MTTTRILQLTDLHLFQDAESRLFGIPTRETLQSVLDHVQSSGTAFDHVLITGDHTHDENIDSYRTVRSFLTPRLDRLSIVPGNHDDRDVMRSVFADVIDRQTSQSGAVAERITFSWCSGEFLLIGLDTHSPGNVSGQVGDVQANWLNDLLTTHGDRPAVVFCHHPPFDVGSDWMDAIGLTDRHLLEDIVKRHPQVELFCCGHVHHEFSGQVCSTNVVTTPSTGIQFEPAGTTATFASDAPGYRVIELTGRRLESHVVRLPRVDHTPTA